MLRKTAFLFLVSFCLLHWAQAQTIKLNGAVVDAATLKGIGGVTIKNISANTSTLANEAGVFFFEARPGDTLRFNAMLYKPAEYIVPPTLEKSIYGLLELLERDGIVLEEVEVYAFPSQEQFERAFFAVGETELEEKTERLDANLKKVTNDPTNMQIYILEQGNRDQLYEVVGQVAPNNFLNPARWERFIEDWRTGKFTDEAIDKLSDFPTKNE